VSLTGEEAQLLGRLLGRVIADEERDVFVMLVGNVLVLDGTVAGLTEEERALVARLGGWRHS
jgi:hypothetical protein